MMSLIDKTKNELERIFHSHRFYDVRKSHIEALAMQYFVRAKEFLSASKIIEKQTIKPLMPSLHLQAQAIELALKGYLLSCNVKPKEIHDLVKLTSRAESLGLILKQIEASAIVLLNHYYFQDLSTKTKYKSRYPAESQETTGGPVPDLNTILELHESITSQASKKCRFLDLLTYV